MKMRLVLMAGLLAAPLLGLAAGPAGTQTGNQAATQKRLTEADRKVTVGRILLKWGGYVEKVNGQDRRVWAARLWPSLASADLDNLQKASRAVTYEGMRNALLGQRPYDDQIIDRAARNTKVGAGGTVTKALGSLTEDLVFTPITPCRIVDTRVAVGPILANSTRNLIASNPAGTFAGQGGSNTNCGIPADPAALALSVTTLNNTSTGYLRVYPSDGTSAQGSPVPIPVLNTTVTNDIIVPGCQACASDLKVFSTANTHYAAFVTGYFMAPAATALETTTTSVAGSITAGQDIFFAYAACPAGYSRTGGYCYGASGVEGGYLLETGANGCVYRNLSGTDFEATAVSQCARVPGR